jgi:hypothetical protein
VFGLFTDFSCITNCRQKINTKDLTLLWLIIKQKNDKESQVNLNPADQRNITIVVTLTYFCPGQVSGQHSSKVWIPAIPD